MSSSSSETEDLELCSKLINGQKREKKFKCLYKRNKRQGMCLLTDDEKSSQEGNLIHLDSDSDFEKVVLDEKFDYKSYHDPKNLIFITDDKELEKFMFKFGN